MKRGKPPMKFAVKAFFPSGIIGTMAFFPTHRQAQRFMVTRRADNRLKKAFGIRLFVAGR